jgi:hypothetical protein
VVCQLTIASAVGQGQPGQQLTSVAVAGTAVDCSTVSVTIVCPGGQGVTHGNVPVDGAGDWETVFSEQEIKLARCLRCEDPQYSITVRAHCAQTGQECSDYREFATIACTPTPCPKVKSIEATVPPCDQVRAAGAYEVSFTAEISGSGVTTCSWNFGEGSPQSIACPPAGPATATYAYECAGTYYVTLMVLSECEPGYLDSKTIQLLLPPCGCPTIADVHATQDPGNKCKYTFTAVVGPPFDGCIDDYLWSFGDGETASGGPTVEHTYDPGNLPDPPTVPVTVTLIGGIGQEDGGPCSFTKHVTIEGCRKPDGNGNGNGPPPPPDCPWWDPRCWNLCGWLLAAALALIFAAGALFVVAGCTGNPTTWVVAVVTAFVGLAALVFWARMCSRMRGFCATVCDLIQLFTAVLALQPLVLLLLALLQAAGVPVEGCMIGVVANFAYYGTILAYLWYIHAWRDCPKCEIVPPVVSAALRRRARSRDAAQRH